MYLDTMDLTFLNRNGLERRSTSLEEENDKHLVNWIDLETREM